MKYIYYLMTVLVVGLLFSACYDKENTPWLLLIFHSCG